MLRLFPGLKVSYEVFWFFRERDARWWRGWGLVLQRAMFSKESFLADKQACTAAAHIERTFDIRNSPVPVYLCSYENWGIMTKKSSHSLSLSLFLSLYSYKKHAFVLLAGCPFSSLFVHTHTHYSERRTIYFCCLHFALKYQDQENGIHLKMFEDIHDMSNIIC